jgi:hypothetical protein
MRSRTTTIKSRLNRNTRRRVVALVLGLGALAIPATASAEPIESPPYALEPSTGGASESSQQPTGSDYSSVNSITAGASESTSSGGSQDAESGYSSASAISGPVPDRFTVSSPAVEPPASGGEGFDWPSAAIGAGAAMALAALGGAALLTARRRTTVSPASTS